MKSNYLTTVLLLFFITFNLTSISQNALNFDGVNDRLICGNVAAYQISGTQITLEAWVKPTLFQAEVWKNNIIDKETHAPQQGYMLRCGEGGKVNFNLGAGAGWNELTTSTTVISLNSWSHIAATYDGMYMRIYINGICTDSIPKTMSFVDASASNLVIGDNSQSGRNFTGDIDEVRVWNVARTKAQIQANMNIEICGGQTGLQGYFRLNEGIAAGSNSAITSAINSAPQGNTAALTNFALTGATSNWVTGQSLTAAPNYGGDSIYHNMCEGNNYTFGTQILNQSGTYIENFMTAAGCDSIVTLFLTVNPNSSNTIIDTLCKGSTYVLGTQNITLAGTYNETFVNSKGCDSIVTLHLAVRYISTSVSVINGGNTLKALADPNTATFKWIDCDNGNIIIPNETSNLYSPSQSGHYAVIVNQNSCVDTSGCVPMTITAINGAQANIKLDIKPNPSKGVYYIQISQLNNPIRIQVLDITGQQIMTKEVNENQFEIDLGEFDNGIYFIQIQTENYSVSRKLIKL